VILGVAEAAQRLVGVVFAVAFEVRRRGVEEQQIDFEVEEVGRGEEHRLLHRALRVGAGEQVHRPVRLVVVHRDQAGDRRAVAGPVRGREFRGRVNRPVGDQREQHPLDIGAEPPLAHDPGQGGIDAQQPPQLVQQPHRTHRSGRLEL
jgi:hypothetical protein